MNFTPINTIPFNGTASETIDINVDVPATLTEFLAAEVYLVAGVPTEIIRRRYVAPFMCRSKPVAMQRCRPVTMQRVTPCRVMRRPAE